jgi:hypothetical protein
MLVLGMHAGQSPARQIQYTGLDVGQVSVAVQLPSELARASKSPFCTRRNSRCCTRVIGIAKRADRLPPRIGARRPTAEILQAEVL